MTDEEKRAMKVAQAAHARTHRTKRQPSAFSQLSVKQRVFLMAYVNNGFVGSQAALSAGYSNKCADVQASQLLGRPKVRAALSELLAHRIPAPDVVLTRIGDIAMNNPMRFFGDDAQLDYAELKRHGHLVQEFDASEGLHKAKVKFQPQLPALALLGKVHSLFVERQEVSGPAGGPVQHALQMTPEQSAKFAQKQEASK